MSLRWELERVQLRTARAQRERIGVSVLGLSRKPDQGPVAVVEVGATPPPVVWA
jgi:hypothetical protein